MSIDTDKLDGYSDKPVETAFTEFLEIVKESKPEFHNMTLAELIEEKKKIEKQTDLISAEIEKLHEETARVKLLCHKQQEKKPGTNPSNN